MPIIIRRTFEIRAETARSWAKPSVQGRAAYHGCFFDKPQAHQNTFFPASTLTSYGPFCATTTGVGGAGGDAVDADKHRTPPTALLADTIVTRDS